MRRTTLTILLAIFGLLGSLLISAPVAQAAARDGICQKGEFCYYYNSNNQGSISDFTNSVGDYGNTQPSCYDYKGRGAGKGKCIKNDAASVWNRTGKTVRVHYNSNYGGTSQEFAPGAKKNLNARHKNNNASHKIGGGGGSGDTTFHLPFPCGETWRAATYTGHSPSNNSIDFNHYPSDDGWKVHSSAPGTVVQASTGAGGYGLTVVIRHDNGWSTRYAHLKSERVSVGQKVSAKTWIGRVGQSGGQNSTHLHYEQLRDGSVQRATFKDGSPKYYGYSYLQRKTQCPG